MPNEIPADTDENRVFIIKGFDNCGECKKFLESYQIIELESEPKQ